MHIFRPKILQMAHFTLPEMILYKQRMVHNIIRDVQHQKEEEKARWELTLRAINNFDGEMSLDNFDILAMTKGSRTPIHIGERIKFAILAENYLRKQLQLMLVQNMSIPEQADIHHEIWKNIQDMRSLDYPRTLDLQAQVRDVPSFTKLGDNDYVVSFNFKSNKSTIFT